MLRRIVVLLLGAFVAGNVMICWASPEQAIGKWSRKTADGAYYLIKDIKEKQETLSAYDLNGELMYQHTVDYEIKPLEDAWVFEFWNRTIVLDKFTKKEEGAAAEETPAEPAVERVRYLFKIQNDSWFEVFNLWKETENEPELTVYKRLADDAKMPWETDKQSAFHGVNPKAVMNYFSGDWQLTGNVGEMKYTGRVSGEWTLDHNAVVHRFEFFATDGGGALMAVRMWDDASKQIVDKHFTSWGVYRDAAYRIVPAGEYFKLVGVSTQTEGTKKESVDIEIAVIDSNHFTWRAIPHDKSKPEMLEEHARVVAAPK